MLFFFDPCTETLFPRVLDKIRDSLREHPRPLHLIYVAPGKKEAMLDAADFLVKEGSNARVPVLLVPESIAEPGRRPATPDLRSTLLKWYVLRRLPIDLSTFFGDPT